MQPVLFLPGGPPASLDALLKIGGLPERQAQVAVGHRRRGATLPATDTETITERDRDLHAQQA